MEKDFDTWNKLKKQVDFYQANFNVKERQIWWCSIGLNVGTEQNGHGANFERPVLVIKKYTKDTFLCLPLTTKYKDGNYFYQLVDNLGKLSWVILYQSKALDRKRFLRFIGNVSYKEFGEILDCYKKLI